MTDRTFIDTNVLIYGHDVDAKSKHDVAKAVISELWETHKGVLSTQVLEEFYVNVTRTIPHPLPKASARLVVSNYAMWCIDMSHGEISLAFGIEDEYRIGFWDALIVASAVKGGADRILSEDLNAGQVIAGVRIENPFASLV